MKEKTADDIKEIKKSIKGWENEVQEALKENDIMRAVGCRALANYLRKELE